MWNDNSILWTYTKQTGQLKRNQHQVSSNNTTTSRSHNPDQSVSTTIQIKSHNTLITFFVLTATTHYNLSVSCNPSYKGLDMGTMCEVGLFWCMAAILARSPSRCHQSLKSLPAGIQPESSALPPSLRWLHCWKQQIWKMSLKSMSKFLSYPANTWNMDQQTRPIT